MRAFSIQKLGLKIKNTWVRDGLSEILATFILSVFVYASGALFTLSRGTSSSVMGRALASACGTTLSAYSGFNASDLLTWINLRTWEKFRKKATKFSSTLDARQPDFSDVKFVNLKYSLRQYCSRADGRFVDNLHRLFGSCANPAIVLMFCLLDKVRWKKYPLYVVCEFIGAFLAACVTYGVYWESFHKHDGGIRQIYGENATANIFTSFPTEGFSKSSCFFEILVGVALLVGITSAIIDCNNARPANGVLPIPMTFLLYAITMTFSLQTGAATNAIIDLAGRAFVAIAGWGPDVFSRADYWFWVPVAGNVAGSIVGTFIYQLMVGQHLPQPYDTKIEPMQINVDIDGTKYKENSKELSIVSGSTNFRYINEI